MEDEIANGAQVEVTGGTHKGKSGTIADRNVSKSGNVTVTVIQANGERFKTLARNCQLSN